MSAILGAVGVGLVWGWWAALLTRGAARPLLSWAAILASALVAGAVVWRMADRGAAIAFAAGAAAALFLHLGWLHSLARASSLSRDPS